MTLLNFLKNPIIKALGIIIIALVISIYFGSWFYQRGQENIQTKWNLEKTETLKEINRLKSEIKNKEIEYAVKNEQINQELKDAKKTYEDKLASISSDYAVQLQQSEDRIKIYQRMSSQPVPRCRNLNNITSQLDRRLTEGVRLVKELTEHIKLRDKQLKAVGERLINENKLGE